jgi:IS5 family transposase
MNAEVPDLMLRTLRNLPVLQPDAARSERVLLRCRAACPRPQTLDAGSRPTGHVHAAARRVLLVGALSAGLVAALIQDLLRVYLRR